MLQNQRFLERLKMLADVRNDCAHIDEPDTKTVLEAISVVIEDGNPGPVFTAMDMRLDQERVR